MDKTQVFNMDCMTGMKEFPDKYFDLAIVDVPYGIGATSMNLGNSTVRKKEKVGDKIWDAQPPDKVYFWELSRVCKGLIIWGANHFLDMIPWDCNSPCWLVWYKNRNNNDFADCELAYTNMTGPTRLFTFDWNGFRQGPQDSREIKIHINQKPVALYKWLLKNYAKEGDKILDTHGGSMSSVIACLDMGFPITCFELDTDYYNAGKNRIINHVKQLNAFRPAYDIEFHDSTGISKLRDQQGVGYQEQKNGENNKPVHRIDGLFHGDPS